MRILQVIDQLNIGGAERVLVDLCNILYGRNHEVEVLTLVRPGKLREQLDSRIRVHNLGRVNKFNILKLFRCHQICSQYDVVHVHLRYNFRYVALAKWLFRGRYNILLHDHFGDIESDKSVPFGLAWLLRKNQWFIGVSQPLINWVGDNVGIRQQHTLLLPNIILKKENDERLRLKNGVLKILHVSNFRSPKNHEFALRVISALLERRAVEVLFVGQVIEEAYLKNLQEKISQQSLHESVKIRHDIHDIQCIIGDFDIALHTAYQESGPLVLIEYLAHQLPFVAYKTGEVSTQIHAIIPDFFLTDFNIANWVDNIIGISESVEDYRAIMKNAFESLYSSELYYKGVIGFYKMICDSNQIIK